MNYWLALVLSLPTENATLRQRTWRTLKSTGAAVLRDGVYLMPDRSACRDMLDRLAGQVQEGSGSALVMRVEEPAEADFVALFDRSGEYAPLLAEIDRTRQTLAAGPAPEALRLTRKLRKALTTLAEIDFFPGAAIRQTEAALQDLELAVARSLTPDEPHAGTGEIRPCQIAHFQGRIWATRRRPWVDRLASAWLIRRCIDPQARLLWLDDPADCPADALGFDFDGAPFSHVGDRVTFEVLQTSFGLSQPGLTRLGQLVHSLDVGGVHLPEAPGVESILAGLRQGCPDDDALLECACAVFDGLLATFGRAP